MNTLQKDAEHRFGILICPTEPAKSRKFMAYKVTKKQDTSGEHFLLEGVYEVNYPHPDAPEYAVHPTVECYEIMTVSRGQMLFDPVYILYAAQESLKQVVANSTR